MLRCKEVTRLHASGEIRGASLGTRLGARMHLLLCRHCRRYVRELERIAQALRSLYRAEVPDAHPDEAMVRRVMSALDGSDG